MILLLLKCIVATKYPMNNNGKSKWVSNFVKYNIYPNTLEFQEHITIKELIKKEYNYIDRCYKELYQKTIKERKLVDMHNRKSTLTIYDFNYPVNCAFFVEKARRIPSLSPLYKVVSNLKREQDMNGATVMVYPNTFIFKSIFNLYSYDIESEDIKEKYFKDIKEQDIQKIYMKNFNDSYDVSSAHDNSNFNNFRKKILWFGISNFIEVSDKIEDIIKMNMKSKQEFSYIFHYIPVNENEETFKKRKLNSIFTNTEIIKYTGNFLILVNNINELLVIDPEISNLSPLYMSLYPILNSFSTVYCLFIECDKNLIQKNYINSKHLAYYYLLTENTRYYGVVSLISDLRIDVKDITYKESCSTRKNLINYYKKKHDIDIKDSIEFLLLMNNNAEEDLLMSQNNSIKLKQDILSSIYCVLPVFLQELVVIKKHHKRDMVPLDLYPYLNFQNLKTDYKTWVSCILKSKSFRRMSSLSITEVIIEGKREEKKNEEKKASNTLKPKKNSNIDSTKICINSNETSFKLYNNFILKTHPFSEEIHLHFILKNYLNYIEDEEKRDSISLLDFSDITGICFNAIFLFPDTYHYNMYFPDIFNLDTTDRMFEETFDYTFEDLKNDISVFFKKCEKNSNVIITTNLFTFTKNTQQNSFYINLDEKKLREIRDIKLLNTFTIFLDLYRILSSKGYILCPANVSKITLNFNENTHTLYVSNMEYPRIFINTNNRTHLFHCKRFYLA